MGRALGVLNRRTREADELLKQFGYDPPHVQLIRLASDEKTDLALRVQMLAAAAPFFGAKFAPARTPYFLAGAPDLGRLTDAASAVGFVGSVVESARAGKLDAEWTRLFLDAADVFTRLHDKLHLETEVERHRELLEAAE